MTPSSLDEINAASGGAITTASIKDGGGGGGDTSTTEEEPLVSRSPRSDAYDERGPDEFNYLVRAVIAQALRTVIRVGSASSLPCFQIWERTIAFRL